MTPESTPPTRSLRDRLRAATRQHAEAERARGELAPQLRPEVTAAAKAALPELIEAEWRETPLGPVLVREIRFPLESPHGGVRLDAAFDARTEAFAALWSRADAPPDIHALGFFDLETTGLSGGTGNYFFLAGLGLFDGDEFVVRQYLLADLCQEPAMLAAVAADLESCSAVVTYNGRTFDLPLVETRLVLSRQESPVASLRQLDLLHTVRRLWGRRLPNCRLAEAESRLIGFRREDDLPGWMAPAAYFDYLRAGRVGPLIGVLRHNSDDILSLAALLGRVLSLLGATDPSPQDAVALGRWWELAEQRNKAREYYALALPALDDGAEWQHAAERCALLDKRAGRRSEAVSLWQKLWEQGHRGAGLELAKHLEHHERDLPAAEKLTRRLLADEAGDVGDNRERAQLLHRLGRLLRKQGAPSISTEGS